MQSEEKSGIKCGKIKMSGSWIGIITKRCTDGQDRNFLLKSHLDDFLDYRFAPPELNARLDAYPKEVEASDEEVTRMNEYFEENRSNYVLVEYHQYISWSHLVNTCASTQMRRQENKKATEKRQRKARQAARKAERSAASSSAAQAAVKHERDTDVQSHCVFRVKPIMSLDARTALSSALTAALESTQQHNVQVPPASEDQLEPHSEVHHEIKRENESTQQHNVQVPPASEDQLEPDSEVHHEVTCKSENPSLLGTITATGSSQQLSEEVEALRAANEELELKVEQQRGEIASLAAEKMELEQKLEQQRGEIATLATDKTELEQKLEQQRGEIATLATDKTELEQKLEQQRGEIATLATDKTELEQSTQDLTEEVFVLDAGHQQLEKTNSECEAKIEQLQLELEKEKAKIRKNVKVNGRTIAHECGHKTSDNDKHPFCVACVASAKGNSSPRLCTPSSCIFCKMMSDAELEIREKQRRKLKLKMGGLDEFHPKRPRFSQEEIRDLELKEEFQLKECSVQLNRD